jgi:hypothetical protein
MTNEPDNSRIKYFWPWLGTAAVIGVMWVVAAE